MGSLEIAFWACAACVFYTYVGYPVLLAALARLRRRPINRVAGFKTSVSFVLCAHEEADCIAGRVTELAGLLTDAGIEGEVIVVSDGSKDGTADQARASGAENVRVVELVDRVGKAAALSAGCALAQHEILLFADSRQRWDPAAVRAILENFADPATGAVSGDLVLETAKGMMAAVGWYWRCEKWLRRTESQVHSSVGVTGAICAVRRRLFPGVPQGTILDDVYWPMHVAMQGYRVIHDHRARAYDRLPERARDEFRRKVRTLAGNFQLAVRLPQTLLPWRNPVWWQFVSHKLLRLVVPWALVAMLVISSVLPGWLYLLLFWYQVGFYGLALLGHFRPVASQLRPAAVAASLVVLNAAAWLAFWVWVSGRTERSWSKVRYKTAPLGYSTNT